MIRATEASQISDEGLSFLDRKKIYERNTIESLIFVKAASRETVLIYTVYQSTLSPEDFGMLLKFLKSELVKNGFRVDRVNSSDVNYYIFKINWSQDEKNP